MVSGDLDAGITPTLNMISESNQDDAGLPAPERAGLHAETARASAADPRAAAEAINKRPTRRTRILAIAGICMVAILAVSAYLIVNVLIPEQHYRSAAELMSRGEYSNAIIVYESLGSYKDSRGQITEGKYQIALKLMQDRDYPKAIAAFQALGEYNKSKANIVECNYLAALQLMKDQNYSKAIAAFEALDDYSESKTNIVECNYLAALQLMNDQNYSKAIAAFEALDDYSESKTNILECQYLTALQLRADSKFDEAIALFTSISAYKDCTGKIKETRDAQGMKQFTEGRYEQAIESFKRTGNIPALNDVYAKMAEEALSKQEFKLAKEYYTWAGRLDGLTEAKYQQALSYFNTGEYTRCIQELSETVGFSASRYDIKKMKPYKDAPSYFILSAVIDYTRIFKKDLKADEPVHDVVLDSLALYNSAKSIPDFKNISTYLTNDAFFGARLIGNWSSADGAYFNFVVKPDQRLSFGSNLPTYKGTQGILVNYGKTFSIGNDQEGWKPAFAFELVNDNTLAIYAYRTREAFILQRKAAPNSQNNVTPLIST